jgi:hypothetical protein
MSDRNSHIDRPRTCKNGVYDRLRALLSPSQKAALNKRTKCSASRGRTRFLRKQRKVTSASLATFVATGRFAGNQPKVGHKLTGMIEAMKGSEFGYCDHCCEELEAFESHERVDSGLESPIRSWAALIAIK